MNWNCAADGGFFLNLDNHDPPGWGSLCLAVGGAIGSKVKMYVYITGFLLN